MLRMARHAHELTGEDGSVWPAAWRLNCVANGRIHREGPFEKLWISLGRRRGCSLGAALDVYHTYFGHDRRARPNRCNTGRSSARTSPTRRFVPCSTRTAIRITRDAAGGPGRRRSPRCCRSKVGGTLPTD